jgi:hypothetical protein
MSEFEVKFAQMDLDEKNHLSNIYNNMKYRGWYEYRLEDDECIDLVYRFRLPPAIPLYDHILRQFTEEERKVGIHRMLIGKDLMQETQDMLAAYGNDIQECVSNLNEEDVSDLMNKMKKLITLDCNQIPYMHIRMYKSYQYDTDSLKEKIQKFIKDQPNYLDIFYKVLNEKISIKEAKKLSNNIITNEFIDLRSINA